MITAIRQWSDRLLGLYRSSSGPGWPWFEDRATYDNARLSQAALLCGSGPEHEEIRVAGLRSLDWLVRVQRADDGRGGGGLLVYGHVSSVRECQPPLSCARPCGRRIHP